MFLKLVFIQLNVLKSCLDWNGVVTKIWAKICPFQCFIISGFSVTLTYETMQLLVETCMGSPH